MSYKRQVESDLQQRECLRQQLTLSTNEIGCSTAAKSDRNIEQSRQGPIRQEPSEIERENPAVSSAREKADLIGGGEGTIPCLRQQHIPSNDESESSTENTGMQLDAIASNVTKIYDLIQDQLNPEHRKFLEEMFNSIKELKQSNPEHGKRLEQMFNLIKGLKQESAIKESLLQENKALKLQKQRWELERDHNEYRQGLITREKNKAVELITREKNEEIELKNEEIKHLKEKLNQFSWAEQFIPTVFETATTVYEMAKKMGISVPEVQSGFRNNTRDSDDLGREETGYQPTDATEQVDSESSAGLNFVGPMNKISEQPLDTEGVNTDEVGERATETIIRNQNESEVQLESDEVNLCLFIPKGCFNMTMLMSRISSGKKKMHTRYSIHSRNL